jgi:hypothetical protein
LANRRGTDAAQLKFPLQLVLMIVATMSGVFASNYASRAALRDDQAKAASDVRDILTRLQLGGQIAEAQAKSQDERFNTLKATIDAQSKAMTDSIAEVRRRQEMQQIQISQLSEQIAKLSQGRK